MKKILLIILLIAAIGGGTFLYLSNQNTDHEIRDHKPVLLPIKDIDGTYTEITSTRFYNSSVTITNSDTTGFDFEIEAYYQVNLGNIEGRANVSGTVGTYTETLDNRSNTECKLVFTFTDTDHVSVQDVDNGCASYYAGRGVSFDGNYLKGFKIKEEKLDQSYFKSSKDYESFKKIVGMDIKEFDKFASMPVEKFDSDDYYDVTFGVGGLYTIMQAIIIVEPDSNVSAAFIDGAVVRFYTNVPGYKDTLPEQVESWMEPFSDKEVIFTYVKK